MENSTPLSDQLANIGPLTIVLIVIALTLVRIFLAKLKTAPWARTAYEVCDTVNFILVLSFLLIRPFAAQAFYIPSESMENTLLVHDRLIVDKFSYRLYEPQHGDVVVFVAPPEATGDNNENTDYIKRLIGLPGDTIQVKAANLRINNKLIDPQQEGIPDPSTDIHEYLRYKLGLDSHESVKIFSDHLEVGEKKQITLAQLAEQLGHPGAKIALTPGETLLNGQPLADKYTREDPGYNFPVDGQPLRVQPGHLFMMGDNRNFSHDSHAWGPLASWRVVGKAQVIFWPLSRAGRIR